MIKKYFAMAAAALAVMACSNNEDILPEEAKGELLSITSVGVGNSATRAISADNKLVDANLVLMIDDADDKYKAAGEVWTHTSATGWNFSDSEDPTFFDVDQVCWKGGSVAWRACSPKDFSPTQYPEIHLNTVIANESDYLAHDMLWGCGTTTTKDIDVTLSHAMSSIVINVKKGTALGSETINTVYLSDVLMSFTNKAATANSLEEVSVPTGTAIPLTVTYKQTPATGFDEAFAAILVPQTIAPFKVEFVTSSDTYVLSIPTFTFEAGKQYNLDLQVGQDVVVLGSITASDWNAVDAGVLETE